MARLGGPTGPVTGAEDAIQTARPTRAADSAKPVPSSEPGPSRSRHARPRRRGGVLEVFGGGDASTAMPASYEGLCPDFNSYVAETSPFAATHLHTQVLDLLAQGVAVEAEDLGGAHLVAARSR